jgi:hypothetical protein
MQLEIDELELAAGHESMHGFCVQRLELVPVDDAKAAENTPFARCGSQVRLDRLQKIELDELLAESQGTAGAAPDKCARN